MGLDEFNITFWPGPPISLEEYWAESAPEDCLPSWRNVCYILILLHLSSCNFIPSIHTEFTNLANILQNLQFKKPKFLFHNNFV